MGGRNSTEGTSQIAQLADESKAKQMARGAVKRLSHASEKVGRAVRVQTLKAEIMLRENTVKGLKQELGIHIYEYLEKADSEAYMSLFQETKSKIDAVVADIDAKRQEIAELQAKKDDRDTIEEEQIQVKMADGSNRE